TNLTCVVIAMVSAGVVACGGGSGPTGAAPPPADDAGEATEGGPVTTPVEAGAPVASSGPRRSRRTEQHLPGVPGELRAAAGQRRSEDDEPGDRRHHLEQRSVAGQ